jgi:hypothetical protein
MFFGLDLERLKSIYGCKNDELVAEILKVQSEDIEENDEFFEEEIEEGEFPNSKTALREIVAGSIEKHEGADAMFGYVLKIICVHIGKQFGKEVADVGQHPYVSHLTTSGPPIPIPYDPSDGPEIGFLPLSQIAEETRRIDGARRRAKRSRLLGVINWLSRGQVGRQMSDQEAAGDMAKYREPLQEALDKEVDIVSFRH